MSKPQTPISVQFTQEWRIRRPVVYRYMDKRFVDDFFSKGALRISTFSKFTLHDDKERKDADEGFGVVSHRNNEGEGQFMVAGLNQGSNAYVLCGSMNFSQNLSTAFDTDSGFRINDTLGFSAAIARYIPGFYIGQEGPCFYVGRKAVHRDMGVIDFNPPPGSNSTDLTEVSNFILQAAGDDLFFMKDESYSHQNEYRLLWHTPNEVSGFIDITCPDAVQYCTRFENLLDEHAKKDL